MTTRTQMLIDAMNRGEQIVEIISNQPVKHMPRSERDVRPWVVWEAGLQQEFRLTSKECTLRHGGGSAVDERSRKLNPLAEESRLRRLDVLARDASGLIERASDLDADTWALHARALLQKLTPSHRPARASQNRRTSRALLLTSCYGCIVAGAGVPDVLA